MTDPTPVAKSTAQRFYRIEVEYAGNGNSNRTNAKWKPDNIMCHKWIQKSLLMPLLTLPLPAAPAPVPMNVIEVPICAGPCEPTWKSPGDHFQTPAWWQQAKIGVWLHWGAQSVGEDGDWMEINREGIYDSSAWDVWGEGSVLMSAGNLGPEQARTPYTAKDIRFTTKHGAVYAYLMAWPADGKVIIHSLATASGPISDVALLGAKGELPWKQTPDGLEIALPSAPPGKFAFGFKVTGQNLKANKSVPTGK